MNLNKAFVLGNLTRDPERRALPSGQAVCNFSIATNRFYTSNDGVKQQDTEFHNIVAFGKTAEVASQYLRKGSLVLIEGRIKTRNWDDAAGVRHYKTEIIAERLQLGPRSLNPTAVQAPSSSEFNQPSPTNTPNTIPTVQQEDIPVINETGQAETPPPPPPPSAQQGANQAPEQGPKAQNNQPKNNPTEQNTDEIDVSKIPF